MKRKLPNLSLSAPQQGGTPPGLSSLMTPPMQSPQAPQMPPQPDPSQAPQDPSQGMPQDPTQAPPAPTDQANQLASTGLLPEHQAQKYSSAQIKAFHDIIHEMGPTHSKIPLGAVMTALDSLFHQGDQ